MPSRAFASLNRIASVSAPGMTHIMATVAPPPAPPRVTMGDDDRARKLRLRIMQMMATMATLLITAWLCTLGAIPAIVALVTAKHVLVAILMMGLGVDAPRDED